MQKVQDIMLAEVQGQCRECTGVQGRCRVVPGRCREVQGGCTICTSASILSGAGRCRRCMHTSGLDLMHHNKRREGLSIVVVKIEFDLTT